MRTTRIIALALSALIALAACSYSQPGSPAPNVNGTDQPAPHY